MNSTIIHLHSQYRIGKVDPRIFGGFLEHMGRAVYEGVYHPASTHADQNGFRTDVLTALAPMQYTTMRYPGGNFASGYHWIDGVGPREKRPVLRELAWQSMESNQFGTDEFMRLAHQMKWTPMMTINLGTGTPLEARNWVEYCNSPVGSTYSNMRHANGSQDPYNIKLWCLGNEMDGPWQLGHVPADQYADCAQQAARLMREVDPSLELVACGSCAIDLPTYMEWDRIVLEHMGDLADYISLHRYVGNFTNDSTDFLAVTNSIDQQIEETDAVCRYVQARSRSKKRHFLCFDEWNIWYRTREAEHTDGRGMFAPHLIEEEYNLEDALVVAGFLNSFIRHADVVKIANIAQIVNVIAPILTRGDEMLLQTIYYPFLMYASRRDGVALRPTVEGPGYNSTSYGYVNNIDCSAILGQDELHVFTVNRSLDQTACVDINYHAGRRLSRLKSAEILCGDSPKAQNTFERPHQITGQPFDAVTIKDGLAYFELPPLSIAALTFELS